MNLTDIFDKDVTYDSKNRPTWKKVNDWIDRSFETVLFYTFRAY